MGMYKNGVYLQMASNCLWGETFYVHELHPHYIHMIP
jgi:hypothetical protein